MKILITGNMGYIGPLVVRQLKHAFPNCFLVGFDSGFFAHALFGSRPLPERHIDQQRFGDTRDIPDDLFDGVDSVVHLAAVSNDPMGRQFEQVTHAINLEATLELAARATSSGVKSFVLASSCSVYGEAEDGARTEASDLCPLTAYARSKVASEERLEEIAAPDFLVTCLRFATACGMSDRLRLDLVLNDFVFSAFYGGNLPAKFLIE